MLDLMFPYSYIAIWLGVFLGIGITAACIGLFSAAILMICISLGMIRIMPLFNFINRIAHIFFAKEISRVESNIRESFKVSSSYTQVGLEGPHIFMWHPHGVFPTSLYFHTASRLTNSPEAVKLSKTVAFSNLQWLPFTNEVFKETNIIPSDYHAMKAALQEGHSISLSPGGMREMLYQDTVILARRRGIFKMALETGTSLVPVISRGEAELCKALELPEWIQGLLEPYDACIPIPTWKTVSRFLGILQNPLKDPIFTILGDPILVEKIENPTETQISDLRTKYIMTLVAIYEKEVGRELQII